MLHIGIFFGGSAREREVSFAGGRTVYDNLDRSLFEAVPIFVDSWQRLLLLKWQNIYKGTISDFYPPISYTGSDFYGDSCKDSQLFESIGRPLLIDELRSLIDVAFLILHGPKGEDGSIQGLLSWLSIPYVGSGIYSSALGMDKVQQRKLMSASGFDIPEYSVVSRVAWQYADQRAQILRQLGDLFKGKACVTKPANEGSSIGVRIVEKSTDDALSSAIHSSFFTEELSLSKWREQSSSLREQYLDTLSDLRKGPGLPIRVQDRVFDSISELAAYLDQLSSTSEADTPPLLLEGMHSEHQVIVEAYIEGREFSCILLEDPIGRPIPLPPTEIRSEKGWYDYRSKYLPGISRKLTPMSLSEDEWKRLRTAATELYQLFGCEVYARLDGFISNEGRILLSDPNTSSGMLPSSFLFHQAAEVGLSPTALLSYLVHCSLERRASREKAPHTYGALIGMLTQELQETRQAETQKIQVAILTGGGSSERHIALESARNVYEKLSSSTQYTPTVFFLAGSRAEDPIYRLPIALLLQDHADDIKKQLEHPRSSSAWVTELWNEFKPLRSVYGKPGPRHTERSSYQKISQSFKAVFIALHGRPGEDGQIQQQLEKVDLPYNGSSPRSSSVMIDKYLTAQQLSEAGFLTPRQLLIDRSSISSEMLKAGAADPWTQYEHLLNYPMIAKPVDDGCSTGVVKVNDREALQQYLRSILEEGRQNLLLEECIEAEGADRFLEISVGLITKSNEEETSYEVFCPSETRTRGDVLTLEEKFLGGEGQNITPAQLSSDPVLQKQFTSQIQECIKEVAQVLDIRGYARVDAFARIRAEQLELVIIEANSLPGLTPATCLFHQAALSNYRPYELLDHIISEAICSHSLYKDQRRV